MLGKKVPTYKGVFVITGESYSEAEFLLNGSLLSVHDFVVLKEYKLLQ